MPQRILLFHKMIFRDRAGVKTQSIYPNYDNPT